MRRSPSRVNSLLARILLLPVLSTFLYPTFAQNSCVVEIPVYDTHGDALSFQITRLSAKDNLGFDLLTLHKVVESSGDRLTVFDRSILRHTLVATLRNAQGNEITQELSILQCPQRVSISFGSSEEYGDLGFQTLRGRLSGCAFLGDWWVRLVPMFGTSLRTGIAEGPVETSGAFSISAQLGGTRNILIVGKDKQPITAIGVNVTEGMTTDSGTINIAHNCPK